MFRAVIQFEVGGPRLGASQGFYSSACSVNVLSLPDGVSVGVLGVLSCEFLWLVELAEGVYDLAVNY